MWRDRSFSVSVIVQYAFERTRIKEDDLLLRLLAAATIALFACGGKTETAVSHNSGGTGSLNLLVKADLDAVLSSTGSPTDLAVTVKDGAGNKVTGATVTVFNLTWGSVTLPETAAGSSGDYRKTQPSFPSGDFGLTIACNPCGVPQISPTATITGNIQGVVLGGPGVHTINYPKAGVVVPVNQAVAVSWTTPIQAASAAVQTNNFGPVLAADTGTYTIPGTSNPAATSQSLNLARYNEVPIAGGLFGSRLRVTVEANVSYPVQ